MANIANKKTRALWEKMPKLKDKGQICELCGDQFIDSPPLYHCPICDHHYPISKGECGNCYTEFVTDINRDKMKYEELMWRAVRKRWLKEINRDAAGIKHPIPKESALSKIDWAMHAIELGIKYNDWNYIAEAQVALKNVIQRITNGDI